MSAREIRPTASAPASASHAPAQPSLSHALSRRPEIRILALALLVALVLAILLPHFLDHASVRTMLNQAAVIGTVSLGLTFVILTGGIDLSIGAVAGLTGVILGLALQHMSVPLAILTAVLSGAGIGLLSGFIINAFGLAAFMATLGTMAIAQSLAGILSGQAVDAPLQIAGFLNGLTGASTLLFVILLYAAAWAYLTYTKGGRTLYAIGSNRQAARAAGLRVLLFGVLPYVLSGTLAAVAIIVAAGQSLPTETPVGDAATLDAVAAVLVGGTRLRGGRGSVIGTAIGVVIVVMIRNGLSLSGVSPLWQGLAVGTMIIVALLAQGILGGRATRNA